MSRQNLEITPSNHTSTGNISFKSGNPVIQFIIGEQDRLLLGGSVRFAGDLQVFFNSAEDIPANASALAMDESIGMYGIVDQLVIKSQSTHQVIEEIKHYPRFMKSYLPITSSLNDSLGHLGETALTLPAYDAQRRSVVNLVSMKQTGNRFSINLPCGLFNGQNPIPLMANGEGGVGGLLVEIHLAPDSNVLFDQDGGTTIGDAFYQLKNVKLMAEAVVPDPSVRMPPANTFEYNSISSYFTTFNSTNAIINFNLGLSRVLGVFGNMIAASKINNRTQNGLSLNFPVNSDGGQTKANITQLVFTRGGERFPLEYNVDTSQKDDSSITKADEQIMRNYMNSVRQFSKIMRTSVSPANTKYISGLPADVNKVPEGGSVAGIGVAYDVISGDGVDFSSVNFGINMEVMGLTTDNPQALYLFVHSKQTLAFSRDGIAVVK